MVHLATHKAAHPFWYLLLVCLSCFQLWLALFAQSEFSNHQVADPLHAYRYNPRMLTWYAKQRLVDSASFADAEGLYRQALIANPLHIPAWLGLAELKNDLGDKQTANAILDLVDQYTDGVKRWCWEKVLLAYQLQRQNIVARNLAYIIREIPGKTGDDALRMAFSLWSDPTELMNSMGEENTLALFQYAIQTKKVEAAIAFWPKIKAQGSTQNKKEVLAFLEMLLSLGRLPLATEIWKSSFGGATLLFNGDFASPPLQTAFGWRIGTIKGSLWRIEEERQNQPSRALHLHFTHEENIDFHHLYQVVPLKGGQEYRLQGRWKSEKLTTNQRPFVEVTGYKCTASSQTQMLAEDQPWERFDLLFRVPEECEAMIVRVRRKPSLHIDNKLGGDLWLTDCAISATGVSKALDDTTP